MKLSNLGEIAMSWYRSLNPTPEQEELAIERFAVCDTCEFRVPATLFDGYKCDACGCPLHRKVFTFNRNGCPKGKWSR